MWKVPGDGGMYSPEVDEATIRSNANDGIILPFSSPQGAVSHDDEIPALEALGSHHPLRLLYILTDDSGDYIYIYLRHINYIRPNSNYGCIEEDGNEL